MLGFYTSRCSVFAAMRFVFTAAALGCISVCGHAQPPLPPDHAEKMARGRELFAKEVRQVLIDQCLKCHGGDKTRAGLDLSTREGLFKGGDNGIAVVAGKAKESRLLKLLRHEEEPHMPSNAAKLSDAQIGRIAAWIDLGAAYDKPLLVKTAGAKKPLVITDDDRRFWSFQPLRRVEPPKVKNEAWCQTTLDRFILAKQEAKGITPNPTADKRTILRRAYFDLIGLPPTTEETQQFLNDSSPNAYERLVDRLLESPHYGERWARHWLDLARFAESHGYEQDYDRPTAYHYRDFVIKALNLDLPYDQFVKWQIAGDEIDPENPLALMATGFLAAGTHSTQITANQVEKERYDELDDMSRTIGTSMLGLTVGCARCHDHKYDPISTVDYYRLLSTFTTTVRSDMDVNIDPARYKATKAKFDAEHAGLVEALRRYETEELPKRLDEWLARRPKEPKTSAQWIIVDPNVMSSTGGATLTKQDDGSILASGKNPESDTYLFVVRTDLQGITAVRLEALAHPSFVKGGPGRAGNGNFALSDFRITAAPLKGKAAPEPVKIAYARATFEQKGLPVTAAFDNDPKSGWAIDPQFGKDHAAVFEFGKDVGYEGGTILTFTLDFRTNTAHQIGRPRLSLTTTPRPVAIVGESITSGASAVLALLDREPSARLTVAQRTDLLGWYRHRDEHWKSLARKVDDHSKEAPKPSTVKAMISSEGVPAIRNHTQGGDFLERTHFLKRGDPNQKGEIVSQSFMQVLMRNPDQEKRWLKTPPGGWHTSYRRWALADWICDTEAGAGQLLARVIVNRLWQHHLGRGIVGTPSDFGAQGERPTHPELLDFLATELIKNGWRLKPMHKLIMMSAAYTQSSDPDGQKVAVDPENKLLWRRPRMRLEAETIRDAMLAVSGSLDAKLFGPGTLDPNHKRRSIYFFVKRSQLVPMMTLFDAPDSLQGQEQRSSTIIAPQALMLMNNANIRGYAKSLAARIGSKDGSTLEDAVRAGYLIALARPPRDDELQESTQFVREQMASYGAANKGDAQQLALADFCQVLMELNEFIYVD
jgi:cytochrome c553